MLYEILERLGFPIYRVFIPCFDGHENKKTYKPVDGHENKKTYKPVDSSYTFAYLRAINSRRWLITSEKVGASFLSSEALC
jgi:hypothetical protein